MCGISRKHSAAVQLDIQAPESWAQHTLACWRDPTDNRPGNLLQYAHQTCRCEQGTNKQVMRYALL